MDRREWLADNVEWHDLARNCDAEDDLATILDLLHKGKIDEATDYKDDHRGEWSQWKDGEYHQHSRRCMTVEEMTAKGMFERDGWWYSKRNLGFRGGGNEAG